MCLCAFLADYVILENLLLLVLIVAPKFEFMDKRSAFIREVFVTNYPENIICGESLARVLTKPTERDSDLLQAQVIDILAQNNLMLLVVCHHWQTLADLSSLAVLNLSTLPTLILVA
jgi:hypothetical protein